jgi:Secretion system C-terminal sorting domain
MWMAPLQEVYEYLVVGQTYYATPQLIGNQLEINFNFNQVPKWVRRKAVTLIVNSSVDFTNVTVPAGVKMTFRGTGNQKIINLDFTGVAVGTNDVGEDPSVLRLFPNPATDFLSVDCPTMKTGGVTASIFDISGKLLYQKDFGSPKFTLPTMNLASGIYFLKVTQGDKTVNGKFVKQ